MNNAIGPEEQEVKVMTLEEIIACWNDGNEKRQRAIAQIMQTKGTIVGADALKIAQSDVTFFYNLFESLLRYLKDKEGPQLILPGHH